MGAERVADGVEVLRLRLPSRLQRMTNVYLLEDGDGVTVFDSGSRGRGPAIAKAATARGGIKRVVLSHAHADHRGGASELGAPVYCHPDERADVEGDDAGLHYYDLSKVKNPVVRALAPRVTHRMDGGPLEVEGTVAEGDDVAGFSVLHLPGHAPGLIGLWRERDRLAIVSDAVFMTDPLTMAALPGPARMPPAAVRPDPEAARESIRRIAALDPAEVWIGHYGPLTGGAGQGGDVKKQLERAAETD